MHVLLLSFHIKSFRYELSSDLIWNSPCHNWQTAVEVASSVTVIVVVDVVPLVAVVVGAAAAAAAAVIVESAAAARCYCRCCCALHCTALVVVIVFVAVVIVVAVDCRRALLIPCAIQFHKAPRTKNKNKTHKRSLQAIVGCRNLIWH